MHFTNRILFWRARVLPISHISFCLPLPLPVKTAPQCLAPWVATGHRLQVQSSYNRWRDLWERTGWWFDSGKLPKARLESITRLLGFTNNPHCPQPYLHRRAAIQVIIKVLLQWCAAFQGDMQRRKRCRTSTALARPYFSLLEICSSQNTFLSWDGRSWRWKRHVVPSSALATIWQDTVIWGRQEILIIQLVAQSKWSCLRTIVSWNMRETLKRGGTAPKNCTKCGLRRVCKMCFRRSSTT